MQHLNKINFLFVKYSKYNELYIIDNSYIDLIQMVHALLYFGESYQ